MKTSILFSTLLLVICVQAVFAQNPLPAVSLFRLPKDLKLDKSAVRSYRMTTDYYDFDLYGNFLAKRRLAGSITYQGDSAHWRNVSYAESKTDDETFPEGKKLDFLQNFRYRPGDEVLAAEFFKSNLPQANPFVMNLIWDALAFESLAYCSWDSLELHKEFRATEVSSRMQIADIGTFENRDVRITWIGVTEIGCEKCAVLKFSILNNPLHVDFENTGLRGRSHYWGEIYVSLSDKQIERANLTEDVLMEIRTGKQSAPQVGYTVRHIRLAKIE